MSEYFDLHIQTIINWKIRKRNGESFTNQNLNKIQKIKIIPKPYIYSYSFKRRVLSYYFEFGERETIEKFDISRTSLKTWRDHFKNNNLKEQSTRTVQIERKEWSLKNLEHMRIGDMMREFKTLKTKYLF